MKRLVALMMCAVSLGAAAQSTITYPYNPDGNADTLIGVTDLQDLLVVYGNPFLPSEIQVGDSSLTFWVEQIAQLLEQQQAQIDSLLQLNQSLALGQTQHFEFSDLTWIPQENNGNNLMTILDFDEDGFIRLTGFSSNLRLLVLSDTVDLSLAANVGLAEGNFEDILWTNGQDDPQQTIPLNSDEIIVIYGNSGVVQDGTTSGENNIDWTPITTTEASSQPQETTCVFEYDFETPITIPAGCNHVVINPPSEVPYWEVKGYTSAGFTQLYNVPLASVLDTISNSGMYDVTEIVPYPTFAQVFLNTADVSELIVECGGEFRFADFVLPSLLEFTIGLPGDDWECDNGVLWLPQIQMVDEVGAISLPRMRFLSQNQDYNTINGLSGSDGYWNSGDEQIGKYRKTMVGWLQIWGGIF